MTKEGSILYEAKEAVERDGALADIRRRPAAEIRGNKWIWTGVSFINFVGPISYFLFGRKAETPQIDAI